MQQHAASFIAHTEASTGSELPRFIKDEFDAFLDQFLIYGQTTTSIVQSTPVAPRDLPLPTAAG